MRHLLRLNAARNIGFVATVSARALKVDDASLAVFFHHDGPAHRWQIAASLVRYHHVDHCRRREVVAWRDVYRLAGEPIKLIELAPSVGLEEASAH